MLALLAHLAILEMLVETQRAEAEAWLRSRGLVPRHPTYGNVLFTSTEWVEPGREREIGTLARCYRGW